MVCRPKEGFSKDEQSLEGLGVKAQSWVPGTGYSAPRLGNQRPWYVQPRLCDWTYKRSRVTYRKEKGIVSRWPGSS